MKRISGTVVRASTPKTAFVKVISEWVHPKYLKKTHVSKVFACHDELGVRVGDEVTIIETRPLSATKHFKIEVVTKAATLAAEIAKPVAGKKEKKSVKKK